WATQMASDRALMSRLIEAALMMRSTASPIPRMTRCGSIKRASVVSGKPRGHVRSGYDQATARHRPLQRGPELLDTGESRGRSISAARSRADAHTMHEHQHMMATVPPGQNERAA